MTDETSRVVFQETALDFLLKLLTIALSLGIALTVISLSGYTP